MALSIVLLLQDNVKDTYNSYNLSGMVNSAGYWTLFMIPTIDRTLVAWLRVLLLQDTVNDVYNKYYLSGMVYSASVTGLRAGYLQ